MTSATGPKQHGRQATKSRGVKTGHGNRGVTNPETQGSESNWTSANVAAKRTWLGYEWLSGVDTNPKSLRVTQEIAMAQVKVMSEREKDLPTACVWTSLLALCCDVSTVEWVGKRRWVELSGSALISLIREFAGKARIKIEIATLSEPCAGTYTKPEYVTRIDETSSLTEWPVWGHSLLIVQSADGSCLHCLPVGTINYKYVHVARVAPTPGAVAGARIDEESDGCEVEEATSSSTKLVAAPNVPKAQPPEPGPVTHPGPAGLPYIDLLLGSEGTGGGSPGEFLALLQQAATREARVEISKQVRKRHHRSAEAVACSPSASSGDVDEDAGSHELHKHYVYEGPFPPPRGWFWKAGWSPRTMANRDCALEIRHYLDRIQVASATTVMAGKHRTSVRYMPYRPCDGLYDVRERVCSDGEEQYMWFQAGDILDINGSYYAVREAGEGGLLTLESARGPMAVWASKVADRFWNQLPFLSVGRKVRLIVGTPPNLKDEVVSKAKWQVAAATATTPITTAVLSRMRMDAAKDGYEDDADHAVRFAEQLEKAFPKVSQVVAGNSWDGRCFSCRKPLPGRFPCNMCKMCNRGANSELATMVAEGMHVCSPAAPIVYPGVVNTRTRHPPLKPGTDTLATDGNFWFAPKELRSDASRAPSAAARAWEGSAFGERYHS